MNFFVDAVLWSGVDELATPRFQVCFFRVGVQQHAFSQDEYQSVMKKMRGYTREGYMEESLRRQYSCGGMCLSRGSQHIRCMVCLSRIAYSGCLYRFFRLGVSVVWCRAYAANAKSNL